MRRKAHRPRQKRLTGSRRTNQQGSLRDFTSQVGIFLRIFQKVHNLAHFLLCSFLSGHILERNLRSTIGFLEKLGLALTHIEDARLSTTSHAAHEEHPDGHQDDERQEASQQTDEEVAAFLIAHLALVARTVKKLLQPIHTGILGGASGFGPCVFRPGFEHITHMLSFDHHACQAFGFVDGDIGRIAFLHIFLEDRIINLLVLPGATALSLIKHIAQHTDDNDVEPIQVEAWHSVSLLRGLFFAHAIVSFDKNETAGRFSTRPFV